MKRVGFGQLQCLGHLGSLTSLLSHPDSPSISRTLFPARPYAIKTQLMGKSGLIGESPPVFSE